MTVKLSLTNASTNDLHDIMLPAVSILLKICEANQMVPHR